MTVATFPAPATTLLTLTGGWGLRELESPIPCLSQVKRLGLNVILPAVQKLEIIHHTRAFDRMSSLLSNVRHCSQISDLFQRATKSTSVDILIFQRSAVLEKVGAKLAC